MGHPNKRRLSPEKGISYSIGHHSTWLPPRREREAILFFAPKKHYLFFCCFYKRGEYYFFMPTTWKTSFWKTFWVRKREEPSLEPDYFSPEEETFFWKKEGKIFGKRMKKNAEIRLRRKKKKGEWEVDSRLPRWVSPLRNWSVPPVKNPPRKRRHSVKEFQEWFRQNRKMASPAGRVQI